MISYKGNLKQCLESASQDEKWTKKEREILNKIANGTDDVKSMPLGTGRIYWLKGQARYKFYVHASDVGYNIGRTK